ncbi:MAG: AMP-binding protein [Alphaproteobacteria bacterium]|nr:AMP-binding protein [Alphaproteobacteria bacterium]
MQFDRLIGDLPRKTGAIVTFIQGRMVRHDYATLAGDVAQASADLERWGVVPGLRVGIFAPNSYAYIVHDLALISLGAISVAFTDDFSASLDRALVDRYGIALMLVVRSVRHGFQDADKFVALMDGSNADVRVLPRRPYAEGDQPGDLSLAFSSGSAGGLKGLVISRRGAELTLPPVLDALGAAHDDRLLLFLPMSNFQQRMMYYASIWRDFDLIVTDYTQLYPAMKALQPTILIAPPVLYQLIHTRFSAPGAGSWRRRLGDRLLKLPFGNAWRQKIARFAYRDVHTLFGGRMRLLATGMAPISPHVSRFFDRVMLPLCESYGLAEAGSLTFRRPHVDAYGSVGKLLSGVKLDFEPDGEIIVHREAFLTRRYFQCASGENESTFLDGSRVATGDIGRLDADGNLYLLGRKKELIVTPAGYKIHPEALEGAFNTCEDIVQSVVFQKPGASHLTCVVVQGQDRSEDAARRIHRHVEAATAGKKVKVGEIKFADEAFSRENGMLRPNMKLNRKGIAARYAQAS